MTHEPLPIRTLSDDDDMTALIHRGYAPLAARGLQYWAPHQSVLDTVERCAKAETWLAEHDGRVVDTVTLTPPQRAAGAPWYDRADVAVFNQLAVDPAVQGRGVARALLDHIEGRAAVLGAAHLACDTSEHATELIATYHRRGYREVSDVDWRPDVNYRSVILSLQLSEDI